MKERAYKTQWGIVVFISAWASRVARSTTSGNAKASVRGTSDRYGFPRLFLCLII